MSLKSEFIIELTGNGNDAIEKFLNTYDSRSYNDVIDKKKCFRRSETKLEFLLDEEGDIHPLDFSENCESNYFMFLE